MRLTQPIYDYRIDRFIRSPHNPQWSFVRDWQCAVYLRNIERDSAKKCAVQCDECRTICEFNDYIRGMSKPNYPVPAIVQCDWCGSRTNVCDYNGDGYWCPSLCFLLN